MILNKEIIKSSVIEQCVDGDIGELNGNVDYLHDLCLNIKVGNLNPEFNEIMYGELVSILNIEGKEICDCIDEYIEETHYGYYGDPAFSSASDYWDYILGDG